MYRRTIDRLAEVEILSTNSNIKETGNKKKLRCAFVIRSLSGGGAERVVSILASRMAERGHDVHLILYGRTETDYPLSENVQIHLMPERKEGRISKLLRIFDMRKILKSIRPDVIVPFVGTIPYVAAVASIGLKASLIHTIRIHPGRIETGHTEWADRMLYKYADAIMLQNNEQRVYFSKSIREKCIVVPNPVSDVFFENTKESYGPIRTIVAAGRLVEMKNYPLMIRTFVSLVQEFPDASLHIYGEGKERGALKRMIEGNALEDKVILHGRTENMPSVLKDADLFLMTSRYEGMPNALMEAMAVGVPCISSACPTGPKTLIRHMDTGILFENKNTKDCLNAMQFACGHPAIMEQIGRAGAEAMRKTYQPDQICERFEKMLENVVAKKRKP